VRLQPARLEHALVLRHVLKNSAALRRSRVEPTNLRHTEGVSKHDGRREPGSGRAIVDTKRCGRRNLSGIFAHHLTHTPAREYAHSVRELCTVISIANDNVMSSASSAVSAR
jgi:hypothetical protein